MVRTGSLRSVPHELLSMCSAPAELRAQKGAASQNGGASLKSPPRSAVRSRSWVRSPLPLAGAFDLGRGPLEGGADLVGLQFGDRPLVALRGLPAALRSRPVTITRSPLARESTRCSAWPRQ